MKIQLKSTKSISVIDPQGKAHFTKAGKLASTVSAISLALSLMPAMAFPLLMSAEPALAAKWGQSGKGGDGGFSADKEQERLPGKPSAQGRDGDGGASGAAVDYPERESEAGAGGAAGYVMDGDDDHLPHIGQSGTDATMCNSDTATCRSGVAAGGGGGGAAATAVEQDTTTTTSFIGGQGGNGGVALYQGSGGEGGAGGAAIVESDGTHINTDIIKGGAGGNGGDLSARDGCTADTCISGKGGDGGAAIVALKNQTINNKGSLSGGDAGRSGQVNNWNNLNPTRDGNGGDGGNAIELGSGNHLENEGAITGGKGGIGIKGYDAEGSVSGKDGADGLGIYARGDNNSIINKSGGIISAGGTQPESGIAIKLEGDNNSLELQDNSIINGQVIAQGKNNALSLGGKQDQTFELGQLGEKYKGFDKFSKQGENTASVSGTSTIGGEAEINSGRLKLIKDGSFANFYRVKSHGIFDISEVSGKNTSIQSLTGDKGGHVDLGDKELIITDGHDDDFAGQLAASEKGKLSVTGGHQTLSGDNSGFKGETSVRNNGHLTVNNQLGGTTSVSDKGILDGTGSLENLVNSGTIVAGNNETFGDLHINGNYEGREGSNIAINTKLGADDSPTSRLYIAGDASGHSDVSVYNRGGLGDQTKNGIKIIDIAGQSAADFALNGDYTADDGRSAVIGGAYAYFLYKGEAGNPEDGNWYLRSQLKDKNPDPNPNPKPKPGPEVYQPGVPLYSSYSQVLRGLNSVSSLKTRVGNRYWKDASTGQLSNGGALGTQAQQADPQSDRNEILTDYGLFWSRITGSHEHYHPKGSASVDSLSLDSWSFTAGVDHQLYENDAGRFIGGIWLQSGTLNAEINSDFGRGKIKGHGYGGGASLTWYGENGLYIDAQTKLNWYKNDFESDTLKQTVVKDAKGFGYALSLETGKRFTLNDYWTLTPQAQLTWSSLDLDSFTDRFDAVARFKRDNYLTARLGVTADYANIWQGDDGHAQAVHFYSSANLYQTLVNGAKNINISGVQIDTGELEKTWAGIGLGGSYSWKDDKYSLFSNVNTASSIKDFGNNTVISANIGLRVKW